MASSVATKLSSKRQITVPIEICKKMHLHAGDIIVIDYDPELGIGYIRPKKIDLNWHKSIEKTLSEWEGAEDDDL
jgi:AbrB family looped-hinge helix DNA binding protein